MTIRLKVAAATVGLAVGGLGLTSLASATTPAVQSAAFDGKIPVSVNDIPLTEAPSFSGAELVDDYRNTINTPLGTVTLDHTGAFYGRPAGTISELCYVGCGSPPADKAFSLTLTMPAGTTAFAVRIYPQDHGETTYTVAGPDVPTAQYVWGGYGSATQGAQPTFTVSAADGGTLSQVTITATQATGCTYNGSHGVVACSLYGLDITDMAIGNAVVTTSTTTATTTSAPLGLPHTGSSSKPMLWVAVTLIGVGAATLGVARRRRI